MIRNTASLIDRPLRSVTLWDGQLYWTGVTEQSLTAIAELGASAVTLSWCEYVDPTTGKILDHNGAGWQRETLKDIEKVSAIASEKGLEVILQPYFQLATTSAGTGVNTSFGEYFGNYEEIAKDRSKLDSFVTIFKPSYHEYLAKLGGIAQRIEAVYVAIGGEMNPLDSRLYNLFWKEAVSVMRDSYKGLLSYTAWGSILDEHPWAYANSPMKNTELWQYLDLIGPQIHDLLTRETTKPTYEQGIQGWIANKAYTTSPTSIIDAYKALSVKYGKPVVSAESGFASSPDPWSAPSLANPYMGEPSDYVMQAVMTQAYLDTWKSVDSKWFAGFSYWGWVNLEVTNQVDPKHDEPLSPFWWWDNGWAIYNKPAFFTLQAGLKNTDNLVGTDDEDTIVALVGRKSAITGLAGNDTIIVLQAEGSRYDGGSGNDTAKYSGNSVGYSLSHDNGNWSAASRATIGKTDTLVSIERISFEDKAIALDISGNAGQAFRLYQAAFNRTPDKEGLGYQMNALDTGLSLTQVALNFINSPEFSQTYGSLDDVRFVTQLYANVLHRVPDSSGLDFHVKNLAGGTSRAAILVGFSESPENQAALLGVIQNGIEYIPIA
ncbi:DUF4214 domain-containing protein [Noviherbaspirillum sp. ST9]|uniref:DUF4214 domain-containing protein n=1 Tax=Noviherbaspirillum sp. ST9 TaxID=3401606 RepID=UPI003B586083